jgi:DNA-directed RNA polymerase subunit M/transcription elongation factor TFIIS
MYKDNEYRERVYKKLYELLGEILDEKNIMNIEIGIYNKSLNYSKEKNIPLTWKCSHFINIYLNKSISIYSNLKYYNKDLIEKLKNGEIKSENVGFMNREELCPLKWNDLIENYNEKVKNAYEIKIASMSDHIVCRKCKSKKIAYNEFQSRKADEGSSTAYTCLKCNYKWKKN